jgi:hypothetical protein
MESQWTPKSLEGDCRRKNSMVWKVIFIIGELLERGCLKWVCMTHLDIWNTSDGQKKGQESNWQFDSRPLKVRNRPNFFCVQVTCNIPLESSRQGLQLCFRPHLNQSFARKVIGMQSCRSPNVNNFETPTWESRDKMSFGCGPHEEAQTIL